MQQFEELGFRGLRLRGFLSSLDVRQNTDAVGGARTGTRAAHEDDGLMRLEDTMFVTEPHRILKSIVYVLFPLRRLRL